MLALLGLFALTSLTSRLVPEPYMDEIFHVPQAAAWCNGQFQVWDSNITTFPGLYLTAVAVKAMFPSLECTVARLRFLNTAQGWILLSVLKRCVGRLHPALDGTQRQSVAFTLFLTPTLFIYCFLYYTDVGSALWVLSTLFYSMQPPSARTSIITTMCGAMAILFRQTNAVWVAAIGALAVVDHIEFNCRVPLTFTSGFQLLLKDRRAVTHRHLGTITLLALFVSFVLYNKSIVLGAAEHHKPVFHAAQMCYWILFTLPCVGPGQLLHSAKSCLRNHLFTVFVASAVLTAVWPQISMSHPYLLSDNRHIAFTLWRRLFGHPIVSLLLCPVYVLGAGALITSLAGRIGVPKTAIILCATAATLIPTPLFEPRYLIIPTLITALHLPQTHLASQRFTLLFNASVSCCIVGLFLFKPWVWEDGTTARLLW